jgi:alcohol dehydrogenase class IV
MHFEFSTATRIIFGPGTLDSIGDLAIKLGKSAFIIIGCPKSISDRLITLMDGHGISCFTADIKHEPTISSVRQLVDVAHQFSPDLVIGIGGGSALDSAKATAAFLSNPGDVTDYLEVIGLNKPLFTDSVPLITIPTTSGTGAEVTKNAVLGSIEHQVKVSLRSQYLFPKIALVDPELTLGLPPDITAYTGLDALTQLIEPYTCINPNPITDSLCFEGIRHIAQSLYQVFDNGSDYNAREDMSVASLFSGLALANAKLGAVHGIAGPLGGEIQVPHGLICACLLPHVMEANLSAIMERTPDHPVLERFDVIGKTLRKDPSARAEDGVQWIREFCKHAKIAKLSAYGFTEMEFNKIIEKSVKSSSMKGNPISLSEVEIRNILLRSL